MYTDQSHIYGFSNDFNNNRIGNNPSQYSSGFPPHLFRRPNHAFNSNFQNPNHGPITFLPLHILNIPLINQPSRIHISRGFRNVNSGVIKEQLQDVEIKEEFI